jgi:transposase
VLFLIPMSSLLPAPAEAETKPSTTPPRRLHSIEKKRRIVEETLRPNASVARVARAHGVNANQVFFWRKLYQQGLLGPTRPQAELLPVQIADPVGQQILPALTGRVDQPQPSPAVSAAGTIYLELPKAQLRIEGAADPAVLRTLLDCLLG